MAGFGLCLQLTHTGASRGSLHLSDVNDGVDVLASFRKAGPVYVPYQATITLAYTGSVAISFESGAIRGFIDRGLLSATFVFGTTISASMPPATGLVIAGQVQGAILYFDGTDWVVLPPGAAGQMLQSNGAGSDPSWVSGGSISGPGSTTDDALVRWDGTTGTLVADSTGWTLDDTGTLDGSAGGLILPRASAPSPAGEGEIAWDTDDNVLRVGTGSGTVTFLSDSTGLSGDLAGTLGSPQVVDLTIGGEVQGSILYFNGTAWVVLTPGTSGQFLQTQGAGANPVWAAGGSGSGDVTGPASSTDRAIAIFNGTTGKIIQNSSVTIDSSNNLGGASTLGVRSSGTGAFDLRLANTENLTANRTLTVTLNNVNRTLNLGGDMTLASSLTTSGAFPLTFTTTASTNVTLPTTGTLVSSTTSAGGDLAGTYPSPTVSRSSTAFALSGVISPTALSASQNDYNPTGLSTASTLRLDASTSVDITGLAGGSAGRIVVLTNVGSNNITLKNESVSSTAANRFALPVDVRLFSGDSIILQYDGTSSRWRAPATSKGTIAGDTKTRFTPFSNNAVSLIGDFATVAVAANGQTNFTFQVPLDFNSLVSLQAICIPSATATGRDIDLASDYGSVGEVYNTHSESNTTVTFDVTANTLTGLDISSVFSQLAAGDLCGVNLKHNGIGQTMNYLGILIRYN